MQETGAQDPLKYSGERGSVYANQQTILKSQHVSLYSVRISFKTEGKIKNFFLTYKVLKSSSPADLHYKKC